MSTPDRSVLGSELLLNLNPINNIRQRTDALALSRCTVCKRLLSHPSCHSASQVGQPLPNRGDGYVAAAKDLMTPNGCVAGQLGPTAEPTACAIKGSSISCVAYCPLHAVVDGQLHILHGYHTTALLMVLLWDASAITTALPLCNTSSLSLSVLPSPYVTLTLSLSAAQVPPAVLVKL